MWGALSWCGLLVPLEAVRWTVVRRWCKHPDAVSSWADRTRTSLQRLLWLLLTSSALVAGLLCLLGGLSGVLDQILFPSVFAVGPLAIREWAGAPLGLLTGLIMMAISAAFVRPVLVCLRWLIRPPALFCWLERTEVEEQRHTWGAFDLSIFFVNLHLAFLVVLPLGVAIIAG